jgi:hypothetical protein
MVIENARRIRKQPSVQVGAGQILDNLLPTGNRASRDFGIDVVGKDGKQTEMEPEDVVKC